MAAAAAVGPGSSLKVLLKDCVFGFRFSRIGSVFYSTASVGSCFREAWQVHTYTGLHRGLDEGGKIGKVRLYYVCYTQVEDRRLGRLSIIFENVSKRKH